MVDGADRDTGLGGTDGALVIDLKHFQQFSMDTTTWQATIGAGTPLEDVTAKLNDAGGRAMAHGVCPQVGIGGHATIGGLGPSSRMWGAALDHIDEVEVVLANSTITTASATQHPDLFWALKGAAAGFGVITSFKVHTEPAPGAAVAYSFSMDFDDYQTMAATFKRWRDFIAQPSLTRKFASEVNVLSLGMLVQGTYFGPQAEFDALDFGGIFPKETVGHVAVLDDWLGIVASWMDDAFLKLTGGLPVAFYSKSLAFTPETVMTDEAVDQMFEWLDVADKGTLAWAVIFDLAGGAINDIATDATAFSQRDTLYYLQSYAVDLGRHISNTTLNFVTGINDAITRAMPGVKFGAYAGYVDPLMPNGQQEYWQSNLPRLEQVKRAVDPDDVFHNPQSVRPASRQRSPHRLGVADIAPEVEL
jgi:hypothetical protein